MSVQYTTVPYTWRRQFVQDVLPFVTSLVLHASIVLIGVLTYKAVEIFIVPNPPPPVIPDPTTVIGDEASRIPQFAGLENNPNRPARQDKFPDVPDNATGLADQKSVVQTLTRSAAAGDESDPTIALGTSGGTFGAGGKGLVGTSGTEGGPGLAPFGVPGGGGPVIDSRIFRAAATKVVFLCDSSGSMTTKFDALRAELRKAVDGLKPVQEFDVIFFAEDGHFALDKQLLYALPENKRKAHAFLDTVATRGSSDPLSGIRAAFDTQPQLIFMLTDGDFPNNDAVLAEVRKLAAKRRVMVNTIAFMERGETYERLLTDIAKETGGVFRFVGEENLKGK